MKKINQPVSIKAALALFWQEILPLTALWEVHGRH